MLFINKCLPGCHYLDSYAVGHYGKQTLILQCYIIWWNSCVCNGLFVYVWVK